MSKISVMDEILANKIAAGEVVEKTMNVVKELVENAIDAKSDRIEIKLIDSGVKEIIVSASGFLKSILVISELTPSTSTEYLSTATNLSANPKATKTSVLDGAVDIIVFTCLGTLNSFPSLSFIVVGLLEHPTNIIIATIKVSINDKTLFVFFIIIPPKFTS